MKIMNNKAKDISLLVFMVICVWISVSTITQAFKCPEMTETQLFLHIPKSFVLDFENC